MLPVGVFRSGVEPPPDLHQSSFRAARNFYFSFQGCLLVHQRFERHVMVLELWTRSSQSDDLLVHGLVFGADSFVILDHVRQQDDIGLHDQEREHHCDQEERGFPKLPADALDDRRSAFTRVGDPRAWRMTSAICRLSQVAGATSLLRRL